MAFQKSGVAEISPAMIGDPNGVILYQSIQTPTVADTNGVNVGTFVWYVGDTNTVVQAKGTNTRLAGFVIRSNTNVNASLGLTSSSNLNIPLNQTVEVAQWGSYFAPLDAVIGTDPVSFGQPVLINNTDGTLAINAGGTTTGYTSLNWVFTPVNVIGTQPSVTPTTLTVGQLVSIALQQPQM